ncbi:RidA family protein [Oceanibaculum pacificum]|uniref:Acetyltransferase n=1 Tax=Oceanibaculum pacificum TaxID=580166 RepID=A0A154VA65_9PROT|nr:RidA family protein [Oceanibaculum pacificum]KZC98245.1 hypothetical protein AUP43_14935 [Oceanibaculum pacificum]
MTRVRISSGSSFEKLCSYSRAVVHGDWVYVSGTTGFDYAKMSISDDLAEQTEQCFRNIESALVQAGSKMADLVRIVIYLGDPADFETVAPIVGKWCAECRPANTTVVARFIDPKIKIEIETTAIIQRVEGE